MMERLEQTIAGAMFDGPVFSLARMGFVVGSHGLAFGIDALLQTGIFVGASGLTLVPLFGSAFGSYVGLTVFATVGPDPR